MIQEAYVSPEVARLLKDKGFLKGVDLRITQNLSFYDNIGLTHNLNRWYDSLIQDKIDFVVAPTHQMAMAWLRERKIDIIVFHERLPEDCYWARIEKYPYTEHQQEPIYQTYEEAVEAALKYNLENLI